MNVKEYKEWLEIYKDDDLIIDVFQEYIKIFGTNTECEIALQSAFDKLKEIAWNDKCKRMNLEQQLKMTKMYLKGEMYTNEEYARQMLPRQIANIEEVLENDK
jgi:hypothetical protein